MEISQIAGFVGNNLGIATSYVIQQLSTWGINLNVQSAKIINAVILLAVIFIIIKILNMANKLVKWGIIGLLGLLFISTAISFF